MRFASMSFIFSSKDCIAGATAGDTAAAASFSAAIALVALFSQLVPEAECPYTFATSLFSRSGSAIGATTLSLLATSNSLGNKYLFSTSVLIQ